MITASPHILPLGDQALCIQYPQLINEALHQKIMLDYKKLILYKTPFITDIIPAYCSISIIYNFEKILKFTNTNNIIQYISEWIMNTIQKPSEKKLKENKLIEIPVCYHNSFALDIQRISDGNNIPVEELIQQHSSKNYRVFMLGFLPGFPYMGLVPSSISFPRLTNPRTIVETGSVGIAGEQTGIYPLQSPGGWNIIGRTPLQLFNSESSNPCLLNPGDTVQFVPISLEEFNHLNAST